MLKPFRYVFYGILRWYLRTASPTFPALTVGMFTVVLLMLNCLTVVILLNLLLDSTHLVVLQLSPKNKPFMYLVTGITALTLGALTANYLAAGDDISRLEQEFGNVSERTKRRRQVMLCSYVAVSLLSPLIMGAVAGMLASK